MDDFITSATTLSFKLTGENEISPYVFAKSISDFAQLTEVIAWRSFSFPLSLFGCSSVNTP